MNNVSHLWYLLLLNVFYLMVKNLGVNVFVFLSLIFCFLFLSGVMDRNQDQVFGIF